MEASHTGGEPHVIALMLTTILSLDRPDIIPASDERVRT